MPVLTHEESELARLEGRCPRCGDDRIQTNRHNGEWVEECVGCWLDKREFNRYIELEQETVPGPDPTWALAKNPLPKGF